MIIAIASGKGGTGKTTVATNLARVAGAGVHLVDCDVEEPNCHLFLSPETIERQPVETMIPVIDAGRCDACGLCGEICQFSAVVSLGAKPLLFPEMCHSCYGCLLVCPQDAVSAGRRRIGDLEFGRVDGIEFRGGRLRIGASQAPPLIRAVRAAAAAPGPIIIDAPPGASCPVVESIRGADFVVLVTEPTPFGLNDLDLAVDMVRSLGHAFGVVVNRAEPGVDLIRRYCRDEDIPILLEIPHDRRIAEAYSRGELLCDALPEYAGLFRALLRDLEMRGAA